MISNPRNETIHSSTLIDELFEQIPKIETISDFEYNFAQNVPFIEMVTVLFQRSNFSSQTCKEIHRILTRSESNIYDLFNLIIEENESKIVISNICKYLYLTIKDSKTGVPKNAFIRLLLNYYELCPIEISKLLSTLFSTNLDFLISMDIPRFILSHEDVIPFSSLFPIICQYIEPNDEIFSNVLSSLFDLIEKGDNAAVIDGLKCFIIFLSKNILPSGSMQRLIKRLNIILYSEEDEQIQLALDIFLSIEYCPIDSLSQLFVLLRSNTIGVKIAEIFYHFSDQLSDHCEEILSHLNEAIETLSYEVATESLIAATQYVNTEDINVKKIFVALILDHLENTKHCSVLIETLSNLVDELRGDGDVEQIIDDHIETLYSLEECEDEKISAYSHFIIDIIIQAQ